MTKGPIDLDDIYGFVEWEALADKKFDQPPFLINPYVAAGGITLLWGETSTGKSPLGWEMAASVGEGLPFFGLPTTQGNVLYIEVDTPQHSVAERLSSRYPAKNVTFLFLPPLSVPTVTPYAMAKLDEAAKRGYDMVILNTLRKIHNLNDKEPQTPKLVYEFFQKLFPGAALIFVHHTKKTQWDVTGSKMGRSKESFSGAMNWLNDAQSGVFLASCHANGLTSKLYHEKSQVSAEYKPMGLVLSKDGTTFSCPQAEQLAAVRNLLDESPLRGVKLDAEIAKMLGLSPSPGGSPYRLRKCIEDGLFPGVEWLGRKHDGTKGDEE